MKTYQFFNLHPIFTYEEFVGFANNKKTISKKTIEASLRHYVHTGRIARIRRGLYTVLSPEENQENFVVDPFLLAGKLTDDAILGGHTALQFYGRAYSIFQQFLIITQRKIQPFEFHSQTFRAIKPSPLLHKQEQIGVNVEEYLGVKIRVTTLERTLVDVMNRPDLSGEWEEIWRSLGTVEYFKLDQILEYVLLLDNATLTAKVGFYLEQHQDALMVPDDYLRILQKHTPKQPHYFDKRMKSGQLIKRWDLIIPQSILEKSWEQTI